MDTRRRSLLAALMFAWMPLARANVAALSNQDAVAGLKGALDKLSLIHI